MLRMQHGWVQAEAPSSALTSISTNRFCPVPAGISEASVPAELFPQYCTIEYAMPRMGPSAPPSFVFVLDTTVRLCVLQSCGLSELEWKMKIVVAADGGAGRPLMCCSSMLGQYSGTVLPA